MRIWLMKYSSMEIKRNVYLGDVIYISPGYDSPR